MKKPSPDLTKFLKAYPPELRDVALKARNFLWDRYPDSNELLFDSYNALSIGYSLTDKIADVFISVAVYSDHVNIGFHRGSELEDPKGKLNGTGKLFRHVRVRDEIFDDQEILDLMDQANIHALYKMKSPPSDVGRTITKSVSFSKRRPNKVQ